MRLKEVESQAMRQLRLYYTATGVLDCQCHFAFCANMSALKFCAKQIPKI